MFADVLELLQEIQISTGSLPYFVSFYAANFSLIFQIHAERAFFQINFPRFADRAINELGLASPH